MRTTRQGRFLVAFYSLSGNTRAVALAIAAKLDADLEVITDVHPRRGALGMFRSSAEAALGKPAVIAPALRDPADYGITVIGGPVWSQRLASPTRAWVLRERRRIRALACFCTEGGSGGEGVLQATAELVRKPSLADLVISAGDIGTETAQMRIEAFCEALY